MSLMGRVMRVGVLIGAPGSRHQDSSCWTADLRRHHVPAINSHWRRAASWQPKAIASRPPERGDPKVASTATTVSARSTVRITTPARPYALPLPTTNGHCRTWGFRPPHDSH